MHNNVSKVHKKVVICLFLVDHIMLEGIRFYNLYQLHIKNDFCNTSFLIVQLLTSAARKTKTISLSS